MLYKTYKIIIILVIPLLFFSTNFNSVISSDSNIEKDLIEPKDNNNPRGNNSLLAYWSLDEGSGNIAHDYSGHSLDGIIHGATWTNGYSGYALNFDRSLDYILLDEHANELGFNKTDDYKVTAWINTSSIHSGIIYMISDNSDPLPVFYIKRENNGTIEMKVQSTESCQILIKTIKKFNDSKWHHIEGIYHGSEEYPDIELYVDSELVASGSDWLCSMFNNNFKAAKIGMASYDTLYMYEGVIDEIKTYKRPGGNQPPNKPVISGPTYGTIHEVYNYTFLISDIEEDESYLWVDWGDNTTTGWLGPYSSNENVVLNHSWSENDAYEIKAKLRDTFDVGEWGVLTITMGNIAPTKPKIDGPINGSKGESLEYSFTSTDLNGHNIKYNIDWGDGLITEWTDFHPSGEKVIVTHAYNHQGIYLIKANAIDIYGTESGWSNPFIVNITEKALLIGIISNMVLDENFIYFNPKAMFYLGLKPIKTDFYINQGKLLITYEYTGKISDKFIAGIFNIAIIY